MIPLSIPDLSGNEASYLKACIDTGYVSSVGAFVSRFEREAAAQGQAKAAVAVASGTAALHLALQVSGVRPGELVILPSLTFIASANAIAHCGATPWLMDSEAECWTLDAALLARELEAHAQKRDGAWFHKTTGQRIAALLPVCTLGAPYDIDAMHNVAKTYGLPVVTDAAAAIGATYGGKHIGALVELACYSFNGNKTITCGGGGMLLGQDEQKLATARHLSTQARTGAEYLHDAVGYNYRMTNLQAAVGCAQLERLDTFTAAKRRIRARYREALADVDGIGFFPESPWGESSAWLSGIVLQDNANITVTQLVQALKERDIEARGFWIPMHRQTPYANCPRSAMHVAEGLEGRILTLPCSTALAPGDQDRVADALRTLLPARKLAA